MYEGRSLLYWCKREVKWAADYLMKLHIYDSATRPSVWDSETDNLVIMVRATCAPLVHVPNHTLHGWKSTSACHWGTECDMHQFRVNFHSCVAHVEVWKHSRW